MKTKLSNLLFALTALTTGCSMVSGFVPRKSSAQQPSAAQSSQPAAAAAPSSGSTPAASSSAAPAARPAASDPAAELGKANPAFRAALDAKGSEALAFLGELAAGATPQFPGTDAMGQTMNAIAGLAQLETLCKDAAKTPKPARTCKLATDRAALAKQYIEKHARAVASDEAGQMRRDIERVKRDEFIVAHRHASLVRPQGAIDKMKSAYDQLLAPLQLQTDAALYQPISDAAKEYAAVLAQAAQKSRWSAEWKHTDPVITAHVKKDHAKGGALDPGKVIKIGSSRTDWSVKRNDFGVILGRDWYGMFVLVQAEGESYCRLYQRGFEAQHDGSKFLLPAGAHGHGSFQIASCK